MLKAVQMLAFTFLAFWLFRSKLGGEAKLAMDTDWLYRRPAGFSYVAGPRVIASAFGAVERAVYGVVGGVVRVGKDPVGWLRPAASEAASASGADSASTVLRITMTLGAMLVLVTLLAVFFQILS